MTLELDYLGLEHACVHATLIGVTNYNHCPSSTTDSDNFLPTSVPENFI